MYERKHEAYLPLTTTGSITYSIMEPVVTIGREQKCVLADNTTSNDDKLHGREQQANDDERMVPVDGGGE